MFDDKFSITKTYSGKPTAVASTFGFWVVGHVCFTGVVFLANFKIATFESAFSPAQITALVGSFVLELLTWIWVSNFDLGVLEHTFSQYSQPHLGPSFQ